QLYCLLNAMLLYSVIRLKDPHLRKTRIQQIINAWHQQVSFLADAYLQWKMEGPPPQEDMCLIHFYNFLPKQNIQEFYHHPKASSVNKTLVQNGYLGAMPDHPLVAFSITLFKIFCQIHRVCPRLSIYQISKALSYIQGCSFINHYAEQFSGAYDCYIEILREVVRRRQGTLKHNVKWEHQNICPPCLYRVENELTMRFSMLISMDGNNSLKLVDSTFQAGTVRDDDHNISSYRWISPKEVDIFKDAVKHSSHPAPVSQTTTPLSTPQPGTHAPLAVSSIPESQGLPSPSTFPLEHASGVPDALVLMFELFAIAGVFVAVCRHGHVLLVCDMIRSGEL
ncbi:hypothetical protein HYPSUDRAFT_144367, partial [Hypholoma sublateritium FD-334 SS-4]